MTASLFVLFFVVVAAFVMGLATRGLAGSAAWPILVGVPLWLVYVGALSWLGVLADPSLRPPGIAFVVGPVILFVMLVVVRSSAAGRLALRLPLPLLLGAQSFRCVVELFLHRLWLEGLVPRMLTFEGANVDIIIGLSAPLAAWLSIRGRGGARAALVWNALGLAALANVIVRSALTAPGPLNLLPTVPPNLAVGTFPYTFIAGFLAPLAVCLHVLAIRALLHRLSNPVLRPSRPRVSFQKEHTS